MRRGSDLPAGGAERFHEDRSVTTLEFHSHGDSHGRCHYTMHWWAENFHTGPQWCGQCYFADPKPHVDGLKAAGVTVRIIEP